MIYIYLAVLGAILAGSVYAIWRDHEEKKAEQAKRRRRELDACLALSHNLEKRGPSGFQRRAS